MLAVLTSAVSILLSPCAASVDLRVTAASEVDEGTPVRCAIVINDSYSIPGSSISLSASLPSGFSYSGASRISFAGSSWEFEPSIGESLVWDLSQTVASGRSGNHVVINEVEQDPQGTDTGGEWIELFNPTSSSVNIGSWTLKDSYYKKTYIIPSGIIPPGGYFTVTWPYTLINSNPMYISLSSIGSLEVDRTKSMTDSGNGNFCWARYPNGRDTDQDSDWRYQESSRASQNDEPLKLEFNMTAGSGASSGQRVSAVLSYQGGSLLAESGPISVVSDPTFAALNFSIEAPSKVDLCSAERYILKVESQGASASGISATAQMPEGFCYSGGSTLSFLGSESALEPLQEGAVLSWDLSTGLKRCRHVVINEFDQNPAGTDSGNEWVELYNPSSSAVNIGGWILKDSYYSSRQYIPSGTVIAGGGYYVLTWGGSLINSNQMSLTLYDPSGREVDVTSSVVDESASDLAWARLPDGFDSGQGSDWKFQAPTRGSSNGGALSDLNPGEFAEIAFNLTASCSASSGQKVSAGIYYGKTSASAESGPIALEGADLKLCLVPSVLEAGVGDDVAWNVSLENLGPGAAHNVQLNFTLGGGLEASPGCALNLSFSEIWPGQAVETELFTGVVSSQGLNISAEASWGCSAPCQSVHAQSSVNASAPSEPEGISLNVSGPSSLDICSPEAFAVRIFGASGAVKSASLNVTMPPGLSYSGGSVISSCGHDHIIAPSVQDRSLTWPLADALADLSTANHLVINEFEQNPAGADSKREWVEIYNPTSRDLDIGSWRLVESYGLKGVSIQSGTKVPRKGFCSVLWTNGELINSRPVSISILDPSGVEVDRTVAAVDEANDDLCWARVPDGQDTGSDSDWALQESSNGSSNGGYIEVAFNLTADCKASSGQKIYAGINYGLGFSSAESGPISVDGADLNLSIAPDIPEVVVGDEITWTVTLANKGNGSAHNVKVDSALGAGLRTTSGSALNQSLSEILPGETAEVKIVTEVASLDGLTFSAEASWGCGSPCQSIQAQSSVRASTHSTADDVSLGIVMPQSLDACTSGTFGVQIFGASSTPGGATLSVSCPSGLSYSGGSMISFCGQSRYVSPEVQGENLIWSIDGTSWDFAVASHLVISEFEQNPPGTDSKYEWVELYNPTSSDLNISSWKLFESHSLKSVSIPPGTKIRKNGFFSVLWTSGELINSEPVSISLLNPSGAEVDRTIAAKDSKNDDSCWARVPDGQDTNSDSDWKLQKSSRGSSNDGPLEVDFNMTASCEAEGQEMVAELYCNGETISSGPQAVSLNGARIALSVEPEFQEVSAGDEVVWTVTVKNVGNGTAYNVSIRDAPDPNLEFLSANSPLGRLNWSYSKIDPGKEKVVLIRTLSLSEGTLSNRAEAVWGCGGACQKSQSSASVYSRRSSSLGGMGISVFAPSATDICKPDAYGIWIGNSGAYARRLAASATVPDGFSYSGGSRIVFSGESIASEPAVDGKTLRWDLSSALRAHRHVVINEFESNPSGTETGNEWVELFNPTPGSVDIGRWKLLDSYYGKAVSIPSGTVIPSGGYLSVAWTSGSLVNSKPISISLLDSSGAVVDATASKADSKNDDRCWARFPDGNDTDLDSNWAFQESTRGKSNGEAACDLFPGESMMVQFNLTAGCGATPQMMQADLSYTGGALTAKSSVIDLRKADLNITLVPDLFEAAVGDEINWEVKVTNDGPGTAYGVIVEAALSDRLEFLSADSPGSGLVWNISSIDPGQNASTHIRSRLISPGASYCEAKVRLGCGGSCQEASARSDVDALTALRKLPDGPRSFSIGEMVDFEVRADFMHGEEVNCLWINDTVPAGLVINESSISFEGPMPVDEISNISDGMNPSFMRWSFGDLGKISGVRVKYSARVANAPWIQDGTELLGGSTMRYVNATGETVLDSDDPGKITVVEPDLKIEKAASSKAGSVGDNITYTISVYHTSESHSSSFDVNVEDVLPQGMEYISGSARIVSGPDGEITDPLGWHFGELDLSWNDANRAILSCNATISAVIPGENLSNNATLTWSSAPAGTPGRRDGSGGVDDYRRNASSQVAAMRLSISKQDSPDPVNVTDVLNYVITYENQGKVNATNVTIFDEFDCGVSFISSSPSPSGFENNTWTVPVLYPDGPHRIDIAVRVNDGLKNGSKLVNRFTIDSDETGPVSGEIYTEVLNGPRLRVNKTALQKAVMRGEEISYKIKVCNVGGLPAQDLLIRDVFDSYVEPVYAYPAPGEDGLWHLEQISPGECFEIFLTVRIPKPDISFGMSGGVSGRGFVNRAEDYSTTLSPYILRNIVYASAKGARDASGYEDVLVQGEPGTELSLREHGSGEYSGNQSVRYLSANKSIELSHDLKAVQMPYSLDLSRGGNSVISSSWEKSIRAKNRITGSSFSESYSGSSAIDSRSHVLLDQNCTNASIESSIQGKAHIGYLKKEDVGSRPVLDSREDYGGEFEIVEGIDDYGSSVSSVRQADGTGFVSVDKKVKDSQRTFESGTGSYSSSEAIRTYESYISKTILAKKNLSMPSKLSPGASQRWQSGIRSENGEMSLIDESFSQADSLYVDSMASGLNELNTEASFSGRSSFAVRQANRTGIYQELEGGYTLYRKIAMTGVSRYDEPHISLSKSGSLVNNSTVVRYRISMTNDGNRALGPVYLRDIFPQGTEFQNATLRPSALGEGYANWTIIHLPIGESSVIDLNLNITEERGELVNQVQAAGGYGERWVLASNFSAIQSAWLECSPLRFKAVKSARVDESDPYSAFYEIAVFNSGIASACARVEDDLPDGMELLSASTVPDVRSGPLTWTLVDIPPGESRIIAYKARASENGTFVNCAHVEMYSADGSGEGSIDARSTIRLGRAVVQPQVAGESQEAGLDAFEPDVFEGQMESPCACLSDEPGLSSDLGDIP
jgi:uncharacterized repeat protein (TIGR01451 family)